jgi:hypothetical protein
MGSTSGIYDFIWSSWVILAGYALLYSWDNNWKRKGRMHVKAVGVGIIDICR